MRKEIILWANLFLGASGIVCYQVRASGTNVALREAVISHKHNIKQFKRETKCKKFHRENELPRGAIPVFICCLSQWPKNKISVGQAN